MTLTVELTAAEFARLRELSARTGRPPADVLKDRAALSAPAAAPAAPPDPPPAADLYPDPPPHPPEDAAFFADWAAWPEWKRGIFQVYGMWRDRGDLDLIDDRTGRDRTERVWWEAHSSRTPAGVRDMARRCPGSVCPPDLPLFDDDGNVIPRAEADGGAETGGEPGS